MGNILSKDTNNNWSVTASGGRQWVGTQAVYEAALQSGSIPPNTMVCITDDGSNDPVDVVQNGNMHAVTSNAVYDALPTFEQYILPPRTYTITAYGSIEMETTISWSNDIIVIPRWLGSTEVVLVNYYNLNNKVNIALKNISSSAITVTDQLLHLSVIRSKANWY